MTARPYKILLVNDDDICAMVLKRAMRRLELPNTFYIANDGIEALELLRGNDNSAPVETPYLVLLDLDMLRMSGLEFLREVREDTRLKNTGVFVLTTSADPRSLEIEVTETAIMGRAKEVAAILHQVRQRGIAVSVDDFGTGYSSLAHLKQLPLDKIKIDRSFVRNIETDTDDAQITNTLIGLAKGIGLECIAEGAETVEQVDLLIGYGCKQIQGYYFSRPVPAEELVDTYLAGAARKPKLAIVG